MNRARRARGSSCCDALDPLRTARRAGDLRPLRRARPLPAPAVPAAARRRAVPPPDAPMVRLAIALICAVLATAVPVVAGPTTAVAAPTASSAAIHAPTVLARGFGSRGFGSRRTYYRPRTRGYSPYRARR